MDEFQWRDDDKRITPRQREVLTERGYAAEDLGGMPRRVASRHIGGELGPEDASKSRGLEPPTWTAAGEVHPVVQEDLAQQQVTPDVAPEVELLRVPLVEQQERQQRQERQERRRRRD